MSRPNSKSSWPKISHFNLKLKIQKYLYQSKHNFASQHCGLCLLFFSMDLLSFKTSRENAGVFVK